MKRISCIFLLIAVVFSLLLINTGCVKSPTDEGDPVVDFPKDSLFMHVASYPFSADTWRITFGALAPKLDEGATPCLEGLREWGKAKLLTLKNVDSTLYLFEDTLKNGYFDLRLGKVATDINGVLTMIIPLNRDEMTGNIFYNSLKDIFDFIHINGKIIPLDSIIIDTTDTVPSTFPYVYGDEDSINWVTGFTESVYKDSVTIFSNLKHTGMNVGMAYLVNKTNPENIVKIPMSIIDSLNVGYVKLAIADMDPTLGLVWNSERGNVEIPLITLMGSKYYSSAKQALWAIWISKRSGESRFMGFEEVLKQVKQ